MAFRNILVFARRVVRDEERVLQEYNGEMKVKLVQPL